MDKDFLTAARKSLFTVKERIPLMENRQNVSRIYDAFARQFHETGRFHDAVFYSTRGAKRMDSRERKADLLAGLRYMQGREEHGTRSYHRACEIMENVLHIRSIKRSTSKARKLARMVQAMPQGK